MSAIRRMPIRVRLALAFALVMAVVLGITGIFVYASTRDGLDSAIDRELRARLAGVVAIVVDDGDDLGDPRRDVLERVDQEGFVQVLRPDGSVADSTDPDLTETPLLDPDQADSLVASGGTREVTIAPGDTGLRIVAADTRDDGVTYTVIVGASVAERDATVSDLGSKLLIGGPIALLLAAAAAYGVAAAALRPVERMRREAEGIATGPAAGPGSARRLPVGAANDEIGRLGTTLNEMLARIELAFERERSFVSDASHELRTPLSILKMEIDMALAAGRSREELTEALSSAAEETDRLVALAEDLLVLARSDQGGLPLRRAPLAAGDLAERIAGRFERRAAEAGRSIEIRGDALSDALDADEARLEQALSNLVDNALRHGAGTVTVEFSRAGAATEISVSDEGSGFPEAFRERAFERFTRADEARARGGSGLGLSLVSAIAEAHGGEAGIDPERARVWLRIPAPEPLIVL
ncbi:HAMP domain-containing protein [Thermoleophilia bacterium SCSIO 60948]|nr:HAMP domain-containing protein [Thermoleophilia bacterium SCSIO 60948]